MGEDDAAARPRPPVSAAFLLLALGRRLGEALDAELEEGRLTYRHLSALGHLRREPGVSYSELARRARVTVQSMHATVGQLEERGLVARSSTGRGRRAGLDVTPGGVEALDRLEAALRALDARLLRDLAPDERRTLIALLLRLFAAPG